MEVVACFLQKYFSLLTNNQVQEVKGFYADDAIVSVAINGEDESAIGSSLVEKLAGVFANGIVTITDVSQVLSASSVVLTASGIVAGKNTETTFTQQVTLFVAAKHWYIASEKVEVTIPEPVVEKIEEPVVQKAATPQRSPAVKPKETPVKALEPIQTATVPVAASKPAATGWAALAAAPPTAEKPKVKTVIATTPSAPVKPSAAAAPILQGIHFTLNVTPGSILEKEQGSPIGLKNVIQGQIATEFPKNGVSKDAIVGLRTFVKELPSGPKVNVFVDLSIADGLEKLNANPLTILGTRIVVKLQNPK